MKPADTCNAFVPGEMITVPPNREGKLSSLSFAVKELYDVEGFVTGAGNPRWKNTHPLRGQLSGDGILFLVCTEAPGMVCCPGRRIPRRDLARQ